jgi:hypothetical protein
MPLQRHKFTCILTSKRRCQLFHQVNRAVLTACATYGDGDVAAVVAG